MAADMGTQQYRVPAELSVVPPADERDCRYGVRLRKNEARGDAPNLWRYIAVTLERISGS
jgi:hypothetical protein